jgi:AraC-like DNA-binding protein
MSQMIALNVDVLTRLTYAATPAFVARAAGTIINIASIVFVGPEILNGVYGGTKAFVLAFSQSLKRELTGKDVRVQVVLPGATAADFWGAACTPVEHLPADIVLPAGQMVDAALAGLDQGEFVTQPSLPELNDRKRIEAMASHPTQRANTATLPDWLRLEWLEPVLEGSERLGTAVVLPERLQRSSSRGGLPSYKLRRVRDFVDANLDEPIDVEQLAAAASLSLFHFHRQFKRATGSTPHQYIVQKRIERAKSLLSDSELPLVEVAAQVGFADQSHLGSTFRKVTSMTPRGFRNATSI